MRKQKVNIIKSVSKPKEKREIPEFGFCRTAQHFGPRANEHGGRVDRRERRRKNKRKRKENLSGSFAGKTEEKAGRKKTMRKQEKLPKLEVKQQPCPPVSLVLSFQYWSRRQYTMGRRTANMKSHKCEKERQNALE